MYDKEEVYDEEIAPVSQKILEICKTRRTSNGRTILFSGRVSIQWLFNHYSVRQQLFRENIMKKKAFSSYNQLLKL